MNRYTLCIILVSSAALTSMGCTTRGDSNENSSSSAPVRGEEPSSFLTPVAPDLQVFPSGIQVTDVRQTDARLTLRWIGLSSVRIDLYEAINSKEWELKTQVELAPGPNERVTHVFENLEPDQAYTAVAYRDSQTFSRPTRFRTALALDADRIVRFGASSCMGNTERPWPTLSRAAEQNFDFFILSGDMVYADNSATESRYRDVWNASLGEQGYRDLSSSTSFVTIWDDHEVDNNWSWDDPIVSTWVAPARRVYEEVLPWVHGPSEANSLWRYINWGATLDIFVLDSRGERRDGDYMSASQLLWLKESLLSSQARFKVIVNSVPITDFSYWFGEVAAEDRWQGYPDQRNELLSHIEDNAVEGVLWVSGDFHYPQLGRLAFEEEDLGGRYYEILAGPAGSNINPLVTTGLLESNDQFPIVLETWTFVAVTLDPSTGQARIEFVDRDGSIIASQVLEL